jgi:hypothetical protein
MIKLHPITNRVLYCGRERSLREVNLRGADLSGADLSFANLSEVNIYGAEFHGADLRGADLRDADFNRADLSWANLRGADLRYANLRGANLSDANLRGANLSGANLNFSSGIPFWCGGQGYTIDARNAAQGLAHALSPVVVDDDPEVVAEWNALRERCRSFCERCKIVMEHLDWLNGGER